MPRRPEEGQEDVHDVLVPELFPIGTADADTPEARAHRELPEDPSLVEPEEPHDVLAAEEFPLPAPRSSATVQPHGPEGGPGGRHLAAAGAGAVAGALLAAVLRRHRS